MIINVGTGNKAKLNAVEQTLKEYDLFLEANYQSVSVDSAVSDQPMSFDETIQGAKNRATSAFKDCHYSIGIESGLMESKDAKTGYFDLCACVIYDGKEYHIGVSSLFEYPKEAIQLVKEGVEIKYAFQKLGLTNNPNIAEEEGAIGMLTNGRVNRTRYTAQAIRNALIHLEYPDLY